MADAIKTRSIKLINLPIGTKRLFKRALEIRHGGSQAKFLFAVVRRYIRETQEQFGEDLFQILTEEEKQLMEVIQSGAAEIQHIIEETLLPDKRVEQLIEDLIERDYIEVTKKGGKTDGARGAVIKYYLATEKYKEHIQ